MSVGILSDGWMDSKVMDVCVGRHQIVMPNLCQNLMLFVFCSLIINVPQLSNVCFFVPTWNFVKIPTPTFSLKLIIIHDCE